MIKLPKIGYAQLELNRVAFPRDGRVEAQCLLDEEKFPVGDSSKVAENGTVFAIDFANRTVEPADNNKNANKLWAINYTAEHTYVGNPSGLKDFALEGGNAPRLGFLAVGDVFTTNAICFDGEEEKFETLLKGYKTKPVVARVAKDGSGYWEIIDPEEVPVAGELAEYSQYIAQVTKVHTMPDGQQGVELTITNVLPPFPASPLVE